MRIFINRVGKVTGRDRETMTEIIMGKARLERNFIESTQTLISERLAKESRDPIIIVKALTSTANGVQTQITERMPNKPMKTTKNGKRIAAVEESQTSTGMANQQKRPKTGVVTPKRRKNRTPDMTLKISMRTYSTITSSTAPVTQMTLTISTPIPSSTNLSSHESKRRSHQKSTKSTNHRQIAHITLTTEASTPGRSSSMARMAGPDTLCTTCLICLR